MPVEELCELLEVTLHEEDTRRWAEFQNYREAEAFRSLAEIHGVRCGNVKLHLKEDSNHKWGVAIR